MVIGIVGLGLIGGSLAKATKKNTNHKVYGFDISETTIKSALKEKSINKELTSENLNECDYVFIPLYPEAVKDYLVKNAKNFKENAVVIDCAGVKRCVCEDCFNIAEQNGFTFIGGHPMAGTQFSGYENAKDTMFHNAPFILTPKENEDILTLANAREVIISIGFGRVSVMTAERHDKLIAFTSQLAHIVSNAYIKSPSSTQRKGISAGSYKDLTRVAYLNENMWTELFLENKDNLIFELDYLIDELKKYSDAMKNDDADELKKLLKEGREAKERAD
ncbi:MAG: prephenate dehydrogenase/arogenate dehydrogenase family protein [Ruminococcaceae bacterium]|nr:prephenate dehydrogenase/arogenate dehydrogenase family protein [Oscillospiraceae bacterium]